MLYVPALEGNDAQGLYWEMAGACALLYLARAVSCRMDSITR